MGSSMQTMTLEEEFPGWENEFGFELGNTFVSGEVMDEILRHCANRGASDITIQSDEPVRAHIQGRNVRVTKRALTSNEVEAAVNHIYGSNGVTQLRRGEDMDPRHTVVKRQRDAQGANVVVERINFRVNISACWSMGNEDAAQITARVINPIPPKMSDLGVEDAIIDALFPEQGLVCVCGPTGSGKTTLMAATLRSMIEDPNSHKKIITIEAPIEFVFDEIPRASAIVSQHEVGKHFPSFARGVRGAMRRAPKVILVGETRDNETAQASIEASQTGHAVYTTMHTNNVPSTISRFANLFSPSERMTKVFEFVEALRLVVVQRLYRRQDGQGRVALREFLVFDQAVRDQVRLATSLREVEHMLAKLVETRGQSMLSTAQRAFDQGLISPSQMNIIERESRSNLIEEIGIQI